MLLLPQSDTLKMRWSLAPGTPVHPATQVVTCLPVGCRALGSRPRWALDHPPPLFAAFSALYKRQTV